MGWMGGDGWWAYPVGMVFLLLPPIVSTRLDAIMAIPGLGAFFNHSLNVFFTMLGTSSTATGASFSRLTLTAAEVETIVGYNLKDAEGQAERLLHAEAALLAFMTAVVAN